MTLVKFALDSNKLKVIIYNYKQLAFKHTNDVHIFHIYQKDKELTV